MVRDLGFVTVMAACLLSWSTASRAEGGCDPAITAAEQQNDSLPAHILHAIGLVESGRRDPMTGAFGAWPWSVNAAGESRTFATREQAIAFVQDAQARGIRSIDVGCMQINLLYHPNVFASLDEAFNPEANVRYAAAFLMDLYHRTGDWAEAAGDYHSATSGISQDYASRVREFMQGVRPGSLLAAASVPRSWAAPTPPASTVVLIGSAARSVQIIEPGTTPVRMNLLRGPRTLPRVYSP